MPSTSKHILLVEDDRDIRDALIDVLEVEGFRVTATANGQEGIDALRAAIDLPDVILLDLMMPVKDGFEFRAEQVADPRLSSVPVIIMSADHNVAKKSAEMNLGIFLRKPVEISALLEAVNDLCS